MAFRTSNPALNDNAFRSDYDYSQAFEKTDKMTLAGTATKTLILLMITIASAAFSWTQFATQDPEQISSLYPYVIGSVILGLALAIVIIFKQTLAPVLSPVYALAEGFFLGIISAIFNAYYPGIALQAVCLTFGTLFCMMFLYRTGIIKVTQTFRLGVVSATGGVAIFYIINFIMGAFGHHITILYSNSPLGIGISFVIVIIAALNLVLDFDFIDKGVEAGCPKYMEWYGAFGLLVTLVWLYLEILRLLAKMRR